MCVTALCCREISGFSPHLTSKRCRRKDLPQVLNGFKSLQFRTFRLDGTRRDLACLWFTGTSLRYFCSGPRPHSPTSSKRSLEMNCCMSADPCLVPQTDILETFSPSFTPAGAYRRQSRRSRTSTPSSYQLARSVVYYVIQSSTAILLRLQLSVVPRTFPLGTSALYVICRSATRRRSSLAENFVICHPPRGERVLFSICRLDSPFRDVTPALCLYTAASSPLFVGVLLWSAPLFPWGWSAVLRSRLVRGSLEYIFTLSLSFTSLPQLRLLC